MSALLPHLKPVTVVLRGEPAVRQVGPCLWITTESWRTTLGERRLFVPRGFIFDGASIPRLARWLIDDSDLYTSPALAHDYLYCYAGRVPGGVWTRLEADMLFLGLMERCGVPRWKRAAAYRAVRLCGGKHWGEK